MNSYFMTGKQIKEVFQCGQSTYLKIRKLIKAHPERYTQYAIMDRLTDGLAFVDAKTFAKRLKEGAPLPPYNPETAARALGVLMND